MRDSVCPVQKSRKFRCRMSVRNGFSERRSALSRAAAERERNAGAGWASYGDGRALAPPSGLSKVTDLDAHRSLYETSFVRRRSVTDTIFFV